MIRVLFKCPDCGKKPKVLKKANSYLVGHCMAWVERATEIEARSTWNEWVPTLDRSKSARRTVSQET